MISRTHDAGAVALLLTVVIYRPPLPMTLATVVVAMISNIVGAMLPDIDQASNRLWDMVPGGSFLGRIFKNLFLAHRSLSHSILGLFLVYKLVGWLTPKIFNADFIDASMVSWAILIGFVSHLFLDLWTAEGIPLLFPIKWRVGLPPIKFLRLKSGHWVEKWIIFPLIIGYILWLVRSNWEILARLIKEITAGSMIISR